MVSYIYHIVLGYYIRDEHDSTEHKVQMIWAKQFFFRQLY